MKPLFICYAKCGTCQKAIKWLKEKKIEVEIRDIVTANPTREELAEWFPKSGLPLTKLFNTSGLRYKELGLKDVVKKASYQELLRLLASEGKLVKRPILVTADRVVVGFDEKQYEDIFMK